MYFFYKKNPLSPPCAHNCSLRRGQNAAFVASCSPSSPATAAGAQAPVFPRMPKPIAPKKQKIRKCQKAQKKQTCNKRVSNTSWTIYNKQQACTDHIHTDDQSHKHIRETSDKNECNNTAQYCTGFTRVLGVAAMPSPQVDPDDKGGRHKRLSYAKENRATLNQKE